MGYISPTGHSDPDSKWISETYAYDNDIETNSTHYPGVLPYSWGSYLILTHDSMSCSKVAWRFPLGYPPGNASALMEVDAYYDGSWHNIYSAVVVVGEWTEALLGDTYLITEVRFRCYNPYSFAWQRHIYEVKFYEEGIEVVTDAISSLGIDHAKGNGTITSNVNATERGFEVKLAFSGTLREAIDYSIAGFKGDFSYNGGWSGTLVKTITETGIFSEGAFVGDLGRFPVATFDDKLFPNETYEYRAYAVIDGETYYGDYVEFTTNDYPAGEELPDDVISPEVPIVEPPIEDEEYSPFPPDEEEEEEFPELDIPELIFPPWENIDFPPFSEVDPDITFGRIFGAFMRKLDTKKDWKTLREKCIIYQENMNQFALTLNHNTLVLKNLINDIITYVDGDVYPSDLKLIDSCQQLTPLYLEEISPNGFKDIINDFRFKDVCNTHTLNINFEKLLNSLNSLYESDYSTKPISYNTSEYVDIQPTAKRMISQLEDMSRKSGEVRRIIVINIKRIFTYL